MSYHWKNIVCPFFQSDDYNKKLIRCEGLINDSTLHLKFKRIKQIEDYEFKYCMDTECYTQCPICRLLLEKYE